MTKATITTAVGAMAAVCLLAPAGSAQQIVARAASVNGQVLLSPAAGGPAFALTAGYLLNYADCIDTRGGGRVVIDISDGSVVIVQPGTQLLIKDFRAAESLRELFEITVGIVRVKINHFAGKPNPYRMNSPTASIAVRGTEFNISVTDDGETGVDVFEGAVEVTSLSDPAQSVLVQGGNGVLVRPGSDFRIYSLQGTAAPPRPVNGPDRDGHDPSGRPGPPPQAGPAPPPSDQFSQGGPGPRPGSPPPNAAGPPDPDRPGPNPGMQPRAMGPKEAPPNSPQPPVAAAVSTYDRYLGTLAGVGYLPFSNRYLAFSDRHADALENPAFATLFGTAEGQLSLAPMWGGAQNIIASNGSASQLATFTMAPQVSFYSPVGSDRFVAGGSFSSYRIGTTSSGLPNLALSDSTARFFTGAATVAGRLSTADSIGVGVERLSGAGNDGTAGISSIGQTRVTLGYVRDLGHRQNIGVDYHLGWIDASNSQTAGSSASAGRSNEIGVRLRGALTPKLLYGVSTVWSHVQLNEALLAGAKLSANRDIAMNRAVFGLGLAYLLDRNTSVSVDMTAARSRMGTASQFEQSTASDRMASAHVAMERNLSRKLFVDASFLAIARTWSGLTVPLWDGAMPPIRDALSPFSSTLYPHGGRFSDFGLGWRISPQLIVQYVHSTDYGITSGLHTVVVRYTFRVRGE